MIRGGNLSGPYHMHQIGSLSEPPLSPTTSSSQARAMPFLMTSRCAPESSGQQLSSGTSGPPFTFIPGDGFLSPALDSKPDSTRQQASAATTTVNTFFSPSSRSDLLILDPSSSSGTRSRADSQQILSRGPPFLSGGPTNTNLSQSPGTSAESSQLSNGGRDGPGSADKDEFSYNRLNIATAAAEEPSNSAAEEPWGGNQQEEAALIAEHVLIQQDGGRNDQRVRPGEASSGPHDSDSTHEHHLRSAPSVFLSENLKTVTKAQQQQSSEHDCNIVSDSTAAESVRAYPGETVAHSNVSEIFPSYNTNLMSSDSYNFPTGVELLGVPTQLQNSSNHPSRGVSVSDGLADHSSGAFSNVGALYTNQNLVGRLGYNTAPTLKGSWMNMGSHQYASSSLLDPGSHSHSGLRAMSPIGGPPVSSLLSESLQDNPYGHGEPPSNRDGGSFFSPLHTQAEAMQLCLNPAFGGPNSDSEPSAAPQENLVLMSHPGIDQHNQEHFLSLPVSPAALAQGALQAQRSQILEHQGIPSAVQGYHNWRNGGNELLFLPGSDSSVHTQAFTGQMSTEQLHQQQQAELGISPYGSRRSPTLSSVNQLHQQHQQSIFQNGDGHSSSPGRLQGLSLSLSSQQPSSLQLQLPTHHGRTHEADIDVFAVMSQSSVEAKGKRVQECTEGRYNGILSRFRPARDDNELGMTAAAQRLNAYGHPVEGKHSLLLNPGTEAYLNSGSNASYCPGSGYSGRFLKFSQFLLGEVCVVRKCERRTFNSDHLRTPQRASWTAEQPSSASASNNFGSFHAASSRDVLAADSNSRKDFMMNMAALPGSSSSLPGREGLFQTHGQEDLEKKKMRLGAYLEEVDKRYRAYGEHMMDIMSQFNTTAGSEAATPYTALALQAMSRHFRCLREAVSAQLRAIKRALGEQDTSPGYGGRDMSSLRFADQQLRQQQRTLQHLGMLQQHAWRPQRGLPERAVSVLRSWLFEHFLHPYPKDSDKLFLAKQTGLTRSQVSNWFINARVRLWKPMVEEMYLEEFNNSDEGGSGERKTSRERRRENEAMDYSDANIAASSFSNGHTEIGTADKQRITIACGGDGIYNSPQSSMRNAHGSNQNGSTSNSLDFDADQRGVILKKARNGMHNPTDSMGSPILGMDIDSVSPGSFHDPSRLDGNYGSTSAEHEYSQHQEILAAANGGRFAAYLGSSLSGYPGAQSFVPGTVTTNGGVSLTLGLRHSDGLSLPGAAAASHHSKYSNPGHPNSQRQKDHFESSGVQDVALGAIDNVHSELPMSQNINPGQEDRKQGNRLTTHLLHEFVAQEPSRDTIEIFRN